ncbi:MAG: TauD/TfdA dioxygenase family protein [Ramlibacter sp.]
MDLDVRRLHPVVGAEIGGIDLSQPLDDVRFLAIRQALSDHQVLVFRDQPLDQDQLLAFGTRFGQPEVFPDVNSTQGKVPQVLRLTNLNAEGLPTGPGPEMARKSLAENWHSDSSYRAVPSYVTMLHGIEIPPIGGDTDFTSMHASYEALPAELRERVAPLSAVHNWEYQRDLSGKRAPMTEQERAGYPPVRHRLVQRHPDTGRKLLFISSSAEYIDGMPREEGRALLAQLTKIVTEPALVYTHKWRKGDVVMWDNRATLHRSAGFDYQSLTLRRLLHRVVIGGDKAAYERVNA